MSKPPKARPKPKPVHTRPNRTKPARPKPPAHDPTPPAKPQDHQDEWTWLPGKPSDDAGEPSPPPPAEEEPEAPQDDDDSGDEDSGDADSHRPCDRNAERRNAAKLRKFVKEIRSSDRSESSRRSAVTERPHNSRRARSTDRTHNSRRYGTAAESRSDEPQSGSRAYRGHHRAERQHAADDSWAVSHHGRHHAGPGRHR